MTAKVIREIVKKAFPGAKFSVRTRGSSIDVVWTDGPTYKEVMRHIGHVRAGYYDGQEEQYKFNKDNSWPNMYLSLSRTVSGQAWREVMEIFIKEHPQIVKEGSFRYLLGDTYRWEPNPETHTSGVEWDRLYRHAVGGYDCITKQFIYPELINTYHEPSNWQHGEPDPIELPERQE